MDDTWFSRDRPVLDAVVSLFEHQYEVTDADSVARTGLDDTTVQQSLRALRGSFVVPFDGTGVFDRIGFLQGVTDTARVAVGAWPSPESVVDDMVRVLEYLAAQEGDDADAHATTAGDILRVIGSSGRDILVGVMTSVLAGTVT